MNKTLTAPAETRRHTLKIILIDDHAAVRKSLRQLIELRGPYEVVGEGSNGAEAIERVEELHPDLVLMDMNMPVMSGAEACKVIKERHPDIKVLALTAFADMSNVSAMVKAGASGYLLKGGSAQELLESLSAVAGGQGALDKGVTGHVLEDMADLYRKEQERADALAELDRMKTEFVQVISHELRTPVTTIKGGALTLQKRWADLDDDMREDLLESMARNCDRLTHMIGRILTVSGIQRGGIGLEKSVFSLEGLAEDAVRITADKAAGREVRVSVEAAAVSGDAARSKEVALALIDNAIEFTRGAIDVTVQAGPSESKLIVRDEGPGMCKETVDSLLNTPFTQGDSSSTRKVDGLGLSLYMATQVLEASGGRFEIDTAPDRGSTFTMVLPSA